MHRYDDARRRYGAISLSPIGAGTNGLETPGSYLRPQGSSALEAGEREGLTDPAPAGAPASEIAELIEIIQRQAPGTLLPHEIRRDSETLNLIAEFPSEFE